MARKRRTSQPRLIDGADEARFIVPFKKRYKAGASIPMHRHDWPQVVYPSGDAIALKTSAGEWTIPNGSAVWIPARTPHKITMGGDVLLRVLYVNPVVELELPATCCLIGPTALLRELIVAAASFRRRYPLRGPQARLAAVVIDQIRTTRAAPLYLPQPIDARLRKIAVTLEKTPRDASTLAVWAERLGTSPQTIERAFVSETGMTFGAWRRQARLLAGLKRLEAGEPVAVVAPEVGYKSPKAFVAMFRRTLGKSPHRYFRRDEELEERGAGHLEKEGDA